MLVIGPVSKLKDLKNSITAKILFLLMLLITIPWIFLSFLYSGVSNKKIIDDQLLSMNASGTRVLRELETLFNDCEITSYIIAVNKNVQYALRRAYGSESERISVKSDVSAMLHQIRSVKDYIYSIIIVDDNNEFYYSDANLLFSFSEDLLASNNFFKHLQEDFTNVWFFNRIILNTDMLVNMRRINNINLPTKRIGTVVVLINSSYIQNLFSRNSLFELYLTDENGVVIAASDKKNVGIDTSRQTQLHYQNRQYSVNDKNFLFTKIEMPALGWTINTIKLRNDLKFSGDSSTLLVFIFSSILWILSLTILSLYTIFRVSRPIKKMKEYIEKVEEGNFEVFFKANSDDEIGQLAGSFNKMVFEIKNLMNNLNSF